MDMHIGFSYIGFVFLLMLMIPNLFWSKHRPKGYETYVKKERKGLLILERMGEVALTCLLLISSDFNIHSLSQRSFLLFAVFVLMLIYEMYWIRYFKSEKTMNDFYSSFLGIPVPGALLPVIAAFLLGIYGKNLPFVIVDLLFGIGHVGIHIQHKREVDSAEE